jgi:hypothetical protein
MPAIDPDLLDELSSHDELARTLAAQEIYRLGSTPALRVVNSWRKRPELENLLPNPQINITVGVAVQPDTFAEIRAAIGSPEPADVPPDQDALEFEMNFDNGVLLDILTTKDPAGAGAIARFLNKFGEGIQQVEFLCTDVDLATALLKAHFALSPVYPETRPGANGTRINFFLVITDGQSGKEKMLLELYEAPAQKSSVR